MGRTAAVTWHASFSLAAGVLYFFFVLPRTFELIGETSHTLGTALRIVTAALIGLAAIPVLLTLLRTRRPEFGTPALALNLRTTSIALHVLAGVLILGTAISEIWLSVDSAGQWLFGIYGAAAAIALLGMGSFYLAFVAELPPPPPKPVKVSQRTSRRRGPAEDDEAAEAEATAETDEVSTGEATEATEATEAAETGTETALEATEDEAPDTLGAAAADSSAATDDAPQPGPTAASEAPDEDGEKPAQDAGGKLQNRRPAGKSGLGGRRRRTRGGIAVED